MKGVLYDRNYFRRAIGDLLLEGGCFAGVPWQKFRAQIMLALEQEARRVGVSGSVCPLNAVPVALPDFRLPGNW